MCVFTWCPSLALDKLLLNQWCFLQSGKYKSQSNVFLKYKNIPGLSAELNVADLVPPQSKPPQTNPGHPISPTSPGWHPRGISLASGGTVDFPSAP